MITHNIPHLYQRLLFSCISVAILIIVISASFSGNWSILLLMATALTTALASMEYYGLAKTKGFQPLVKYGVLLAIGYLAAIFISSRDPRWDILPVMTLALSLFLIFANYFRKGDNPLVNIAITFFSLIYLAIPMGCTIQINYFFAENGPQDGRWWLCYLLAITYITNSTALFIGKSMGKNKLAPYISPKKTWEGAIGGLLSAILVGLVFSQLTFIPIQLDVMTAILLSTAISIFAQFGDLAESLLKRNVGVKDSASLPGLGGMLDVVDSLLFTAPFLYLYLKFMSTP